MEELQASLLHDEGSSYAHPNNSETEGCGCCYLLAKYVLKFTMWVVFVAWVALFFLAPSDFGVKLYDHWVDATSGTLFGETGSALLLYCGPILIIAFLAGPYLIISHQQYGQEHFQEKKVPRFRLWTFPVLVNGPFGVVSAAELIAILLFTVFLLWALYAYTITDFNMLPSYGDLTPGEKRVQMLQMSAYCFGLIALPCVAFLFLPITRGSILLRLIDIPFEHGTRYHVWLGNLTMFLLTLHGMCYMVVWMIRGILLSSIVEWKSSGGANFAGVICYALGLLIWVTALPVVRKQFFELFFYTHQLYILFIIFMALHIGDTSFSQAAGGIFLFMLDRFLRFCQSRKTVNIASASCYPSGTMKLVFSKPPNLRCNALSFIFLRVREISCLQWHPFSVSSAPLEDMYHLSVLMKPVGDWTMKLRGKLINICSAEFQIPLPSHLHSEITASIEGPYGHEKLCYLMYSRLILVAGGSGIFPFLAILNDILHRIKEKKSCLPRNIMIVWAVKSSNELSLLSKYRKESISPFSSNKLNIEFQFYVTRESEPLLEDGEIHEAMSSSTILSKGHSISVLVGTGNEIWPGIYIIVSTIGFVLVLGLLDMYYINRFDVSYTWYKGLLLVTCMVVTVFIFGGFVVILWNHWETSSSTREEDEGEGNKFLLKEEEAVSEKDTCQEYLAGVKTIYGCRPNFKEIFGLISDNWGCFDVGVFVCGPATLLSGVAKECRSYNLRRRSCQPIFHFNSHSFDL